MLKLGSVGNSVSTIQYALGLNTDGIFGKKTHIAVIEFQTRNGLVPDGIVGNKTLYKISVNKIDNTYRSIKFQLTKHSIKEADIDNRSELVNAIIPLFKDTPRIRVILMEGIKAIYPYRVELKLDTPIAIAHFFGQIRQEVGRSWVSKENLNYSPRGLINTFSFYRKHPALARLHGRTSNHKADQEAIANNAYANRVGNGSAKSGDGWKFRGGGSKMVTFRDNHLEMNRYTSSHMPEVYIKADFLIQPHLKWHVAYDLLTGAIFWGQNSIGNKAAKGLDRATSYSITEVINKHTNSYQDRWNHTISAAKLLGVI